MFDWSVACWSNTIYIFQYFFNQQTICQVQNTSLAYKIFLKTLSVLEWYNQYTALSHHRQWYSPDEWTSPYQPCGLSHWASLPPSGVHPSRQVTRRSDCNVWWRQRLCWQGCTLVGRRARIRSGSEDARGPISWKTCPGCFARNGLSVSALLPLLARTLIRLCSEIINVSKL